MSTPDFERVRAAFLAARDLDDDARGAVLRETCAGDAALRAEVESLLIHHDAAPVFETTPFLAAAADAIRDVEEQEEARLPRSFGPFELLEVIGRGGMGTVYRARQRTPDRTVALKVIRAGMLSSSMLARFRHETDVLARLRHPGIAPIYEAGSVEDGGAARPYFAMELVDGRPIDRDAEERRLDVRSRLEMLARVCDAVHHAHQKGVIHRDLKPGNILVDASGQPKVLDFGIARATDADVRATTLQTSVGELVGTLPYMSPEQLVGDPRRLDIRSDVYALGVLIFELLTGRLPHDLHGKTLADAVLAVRDAEPFRLGAIVPVLHRDLETIVGKALEKEPARRYDSAAALADDLRRYLTHQPIVARPPSVTYQARLFARRHRALVTAGVVAALTLVLATVISVGFAVHSKRAADRESRQRRAAERTSEHLKSVLTLADPHRPGGEPSISEILDLMIARLDSEPELPEVEAAVRGVIGETLMNRRQPGRALGQLERAAALWREIDSGGAPLADILATLATARLYTGDFEGSEAAYRKVLAMPASLGAGDLEGVQSGLLDLLAIKHRFDESLPIARALLERARIDRDPVRTVARLRQLARIQTGRGAHDDAERALNEAGEIVTSMLPESHPMRTGVFLDLSQARAEGGDLVGALEASTRAYELSMRVRTPGSFDWIAALQQHLLILDLLGRLEEEAAILAGAVPALRAEVGLEHPHARSLAIRLAQLFERLGEPEKARAVREVRGAGAAAPPG